jgi:hypothetical protein
MKREHGGAAIDQSFPANPPGTNQKNPSIEQDSSNGREVVLATVPNPSSFGLFATRAFCGMRAGEASFDSAARQISTNRILWIH